MTYSYPGLGGEPIVITSVKCLITGQSYSAGMIIDTGAMNTSFPACLAEVFEHSNAHPEVVRKQDAVVGVGGKSDAFLHSVQVSLIDPSKSTNTKHVVAWSSNLEKVPFIEKFESPYGLIGMDIIKNWQELSFVPRKGGGLIIRITV